ncbi:MAG: hypothetical protein IEMM0008_1403 [bacterium]|nr:MAG: hypothetical protein IEMM0008_1403 [bacterium]
MPGYCGRCNSHYDCHYTEHDKECEGQETGIISGSVEDFEQQRQQNDWPDDVAEEMWNENFR